MAALNGRLPGVAERLDCRTERVPFCTSWLWTGELNRNDYGRLSVMGERLMAHRLSYERHVGPIPEGLILDHTCRVRSCINPAHLEPVTVQVNTLRGEALLFGRDRSPIGGQLWK